MKEAEHDGKLHGFHPIPGRMVGVNGMEVPADFIIGVDMRLEVGSTEKHVMHLVYGKPLHGQVFKKVLDLVHTRIMRCCCFIRLLFSPCVRISL